MQWVRRAVHQRRLGRLAHEDAGVAMLTALLLMMVLAALSVLVLGIIVNQAKPTLFAEKNTRTIYGAEAGVEAALGRIRNAESAPDFTGTIYGDPHQLPCTLDGVLDASSATYLVDVQYFAEDPSGKDATWLASHEISCSSSTGTGTVLPAYALITSRAQDTSFTKVQSTQADRSISMVYQFETTTTNIKGGHIWSWNTGSGSQFCLRADTTAAGSSVRYVAAVDCAQSANDDRELWVYDTDYTLKLASSTLTSTPLCLTTESGTAIKLRDCTTPSYTQMWSWHSSGNATWQGQNSSIADNGNCLSAGTRTSGNPVAGDVLTVKNPCASQAAWGSFSPDPAVGPGAASVNTHQIVNYLEFGRCMDVTDTDVNKAFMISYPCKQDPPAAANLYWNHKWFYQEPLVGVVAPVQLIYVYNSSGVQYCLQTPNAQTNPGASGVSQSNWYPTLTVSCNINDPRQQWTRATATGSKTTSYTIRDSSGRCIGVSGNRYLGNWSALVVSACDGSTAQKWNAPADQVDAKVGNYLEENS